MGLTFGHECHAVSERVIRGEWNTPRDDLESLILVLIRLSTDNTSCISMSTGKERVGYIFSHP